MPRLPDFDRYHATCSPFSSNCRQQLFNQGGGWDQILIDSGIFGGQAGFFDLRQAGIPKELRIRKLYSFEFRSGRHPVAQPFADFGEG